ncbi:AAA family ATPase [Aliidiomarina haloalkalitolerans]|uniref:endopeptidase La n=1 Tax=Aliidiomarina haloalkalitolerans TaxID=859059 RepID=A0A432VYA5_9GAMM|nr:AAA family ATPase [Aliidiomarina haloalkalitolerans]RUO21659.1 Lon protease family protein [Aliidiomarina haloalkalitolerans]
MTTSQTSELNSEQQIQAKRQKLRLLVEQLQADVRPWLEHLPAVSNPDPLVGQTRATTAIARAQQIRSNLSHIYMATPAGVIVEDVLDTMSQRQQWSCANLRDWVYLANPSDERAPICVSLPPGTAEAALTGLWEYLEQAPEQREVKYQELIDNFSSAEFRHYLDLVKTMSFDDIPGSELATVIVSHTERKAWYFCDRVSQTTLFGDIRLQSVEGTISTELHLIKPGAVLKANGGTLVVNALQLLTQPDLWNQLKHVLRTGKFEWAQPTAQQTAIHYEPDPVPIDLKVILVGGRELYSQLKDLDGEFSNLFPYFAELSSYYPTKKEPVAPYFDFLTYVQNRARCRPLTADAIAELLATASRFTEHQHELSLDAVMLVQLLEEAEVLAALEGEPNISAEHLREAERESEHRDRLLAELNWQSILEQQIKIDTDGEVIGQINGLTVVHMGGVEFGEPSRITTTIHYGDGDIIDIERKAELSGAIHTKGIMILTAYLANLFARQEPMPLSATLVFEQSYHEVDGDSASLAELCCLVSALSELPIQQTIAVTGAIDQFGNVQAIGGINQKIQGYFEICKRRGLNGKHAVIVPQSNVMNIHLSPEVRAAVLANQFSIYAVSHATEAFELLMQTPCGEALKFDDQTIFGLIYRRLQTALAAQQSSPEPWWKRLFSGRRAENSAEN